MDIEAVLRHSIGWFQPFAFIRHGGSTPDGWTPEAHHKRKGGGTKARRGPRPRSRSRSGCFAGDVLVLTPTGYRPIASLTPGDCLLSYATSIQRVTVRRVLKVLRHEERPIYTIHLDGETDILRATEGHALLTTRGWRRLKQLRAGDCFLTEQGLPGSRVRAIEGPSEAGTVFNLRTAGEHTFIVQAGIIAHNYSFLRMPRSLASEIWYAVGDIVRRFSRGIGDDPAVKAATFKARARSSRAR